MGAQVISALTLLQLWYARACKMWCCADMYSDGQGDAWARAHPLQGWALKAARKCLEICTTTTTCTSYHQTKEAARHVLLQVAHTMALRKTIILLLAPEFTSQKGSTGFRPVNWW